MNSSRQLLILASLLVLFAPISRAQTNAPAAREVPGVQPDGSVLLPNQWLLRPVGRHLVVGDFPVNIAMHPSGRFAAVLHCGHGQHEIVVIDMTAEKLVSRVALNEAFYGVAFSADGKKLFCSGAGDEVMHGFQFSGGFLSEPHTIPLRDASERGIPSGVALTRDGRTLFAANVWGHRISVVDLKQRRLAAEILVGTNGAAASVTSGSTPARTEDEAAIAKRAEAILDDARSNDPFPYTCLVDEKRGRLYVSLWAQAAVAVIDIKSRRVVARWATEEHPNEMLLTKSGKHLYVANANRNTVSVLDTATGRTVESLLAELQPSAPPGNTPNSLALSPDEKLLFVANANINTLAVFDVSDAGHSRSLGFIPVGWYPTSVRVTPDGRKLIVANGKGIIPKSNRHGPQPDRATPGNIREYIGGLMQGTVSFIDLPSRDKFEEQLKAYTARAYRCMPAAQTTTAAHPSAPTMHRSTTPIHYCIYIIKENRTYDQVLGDMPEGNGDPSICIFPESVTPNHHKLAREFVLLDNFYVESEVSADGHEWTMGAYATDFVEKSWPMSYGHNQHKKYPYPSEGNFPIATPAGGYLWDRAREAGVTYRSYGEFVTNGRTTNHPATSRVPALKGNFDPWFWSFDMDYPDVKRAERFISELKRFEREGDMPRLQIVRLSSDHTSGTTPGKPTPRAQVADNDLALGMVVEALSKSKFWPQMAIFVVEDDAQNGPDHVDAHRTIAFVVSPYAKRRAVDSTMYSTSSMLRTMELILGLKPMSQFDAAATPLYHSFQAHPDPRPYEALPVTVDLNERNLRTAWGAEASKKMDFSREDAVDDLLLNEVIWRSVKGPDSPMPAPRRAAFVFAHNEDDEEEE